MQNIHKICHIFMWNPSFRGSSEILPSYAIPHAIPYAILPFTFTESIPQELKDSKMQSKMFTNTVDKILMVK